MHPTDFYAPTSLAPLLGQVPADLVVMCEAEAVVNFGRELAHRLHARLVYDAHDDEAALSASLGEPNELARQKGTAQRHALRTADHVIVSTRHEEGLAADNGVSSERIAMLPNGADPHRHVCWGPDTRSER